MFLTRKGCILFLIKEIYVTHWQLVPIKRNGQLLKDFFVLQVLPSKEFPWSLLLVVLEIQYHEINLQGLSSWGERKIHKTFMKPQLWTWPPFCEQSRVHGVCNFPLSCADPPSICLWGLVSSWDWCEMDFLPLPWVNWWAEDAPNNAYVLFHV